MIESIWQQVLIGLALGLAVAYLVFYAVSHRRHADECTDCPTLKVFDKRRKGKVPTRI